MNVKKDNLCCWMILILCILDFFWKLLVIELIVDFIYLLDSIGNNEGGVGYLSGSL